MASILTERQKKKYKEITGKKKPSFKEVIKSLSKPKKEREWYKYEKKHGPYDPHRIDKVIRQLEKEAASKKERKKRGKTAR